MHFFCRSFNQSFSGVLFMFQIENQSEVITLKNPEGWPFESFEGINPLGGGPGGGPGVPD
jgi:hypothetical protein